MSTKKYKVYIKDRLYNEWTLTDLDTDHEISDKGLLSQFSFQPIEHKIFTRDVVEISESGTIKVVSSYLKTCSYIAGVLILEGNKTYGRTSNKKRLLYKCIPDDPRLPIFIIPYEIKIGFSKVYKNKFVTFQFSNWDGKHPQGTLLETIGDIDNLESFYEYQLYCKSLHISLSEFNNKTRSMLNKKTNDEYVQMIFQNPNYCIEDRRSKYIFTIDPPHSLDFDDGFGIERVGENWLVSIYIANVLLWLETLGLWNSFSQRVATIYLPDRRRPMLPTILSDTLCSLQQDQPRFALVMDMMFDKHGKLIDDYPIVYKNVLINVNKNYNYEDPKMLNNDISYKNLFDLSSMMDKTIINSHDIVAFWMVQMNAVTGSFMANNKIGIFRSAAYINSNLRSDVCSCLKTETARVIKSWNNTIGQYIPYADDIDLEHELMKIRYQDTNSKGSKMYIHITSPIRRLVDLLNQIVMLDYSRIVTTMSADAKLFLRKWVEQIDYVNTSMRSIRKIQNDCELLTRCFNNPEIMEVEHIGTVFDKIVKHDSTITYMVYLEDLKLLSRINTDADISNYTDHKFKIYLFDDEDKVKKKIRLQIVV